MITGFRYYWRRYLGWFPLQPCINCWRWYWGGLPIGSWEASFQEFLLEALPRFGMRRGGLGLKQLPRISQNEYILILANDIGLSTHERRMAHIRQIVGRRVRDLDQLSKFEKSQVIDKFKQWKENQKPELPEREEE